MIHINFNGIKTTLASLTFFSLNISFSNNSSEKEKFEELPEKMMKPIFKIKKTTLCSSRVSQIQQFKDDLNVYFFVGEEKELNSWNLVSPILEEKSSGRITQYGLGQFALEGCGGGLNRTDSIMYQLKNQKDKGYQIHMRPLIVDNELLRNFEFIDSGTKLSDLINNSTDLDLYSKESFKWIHNQYRVMVLKHDLD